MKIIEKKAKLIVDSLYSKNFKDLPDREIIHKDVLDSLKYFRKESFLKIKNVSIRLFATLYPVYLLAFPIFMRDAFLAGTFTLDCTTYAGFFFISIFSNAIALVAAGSAVVGLFFLTQWIIKGNK